jgi:ABC-type nickel/cobalt efflux system permease component RcnA
MEVRIEKMSPYDMNICPDADDFHTVRRMFSPYLYPFVIEFCILIVGIFYMMWANINHCPKKLSAHGHGHGHSGSNHHDNHNHNEGMYPSLSSIKEENHHHHRPPSETSDHCNTLVSHDNEYKSNLVIYADCHAASRGLFGRQY